MTVRIHVGHGKVEWSRPHAFVLRRKETTLAVAQENWDPALALIQRCDVGEAVWRSYKNILLLGEDNTIKTIDLGLVTLEPS